jgi:predicted transcriptional regulator
MGDLSDFERGQIVGARLAGASVIKSTTLLGVSRTTVSKVMSTYTNHGKTTSAKRDSERKSTLTEIDRRALRIVSKNRINTAAAQVNCSRTEYVFILKTLFPQKLSNVSSTNPTSTVGLELLNLRLLKVMHRCVNNGVTTLKPGYQTTGNVRDMLK